VADEKAALRRSLSDADVQKSKVEQCPGPPAPLKSPSLLARIRRKSKDKSKEHKKNKQEKRDAKDKEKSEGKEKEKGESEKCDNKEKSEKNEGKNDATRPKGIVKQKNVSSKEDLTATTPEKDLEGDNALETAGQDAEAAEEQGKVSDKAASEAGCSDKKEGEQTETVSFLRRVSVKLKSPFSGSGKSKFDFEEDSELKSLRERAKFMREKRLEVLDLTEDGTKKACVRKASVLEMCGAMKAGRYTFALLSSTRLLARSLAVALTWPRTLTLLTHLTSTLPAVLCSTLIVTLCL
jgi:hypothetical protein